MPKRRSVKPAANPQPGPPADPGVREEILATTRSVIQRYGLRKTTMDDIARAMGRERSSLYYYFPGRDELIRAFIQNELMEMAQVVHTEVARHKDAIGRMRAYVIARLEQVAERVSVYGETVPQYRAGSDIQQMTEQRQTFDEAEQRFFADLIMDGIRDGQLRRLSEAEVLLFTRFAFSAIRGVELELVLDPLRATDLKMQAQVAMDIFSRGLAR
jgi:AcrR family transcriptional regulator